MAKYLSFHEAAKMLQTTNVKLLNFLRDQKIMFRSNNTNLPYQKYIEWFFVKPVKLDNRDIPITVPIIRIRAEGFEKIKAIYENKLTSIFVGKAEEVIQQKYNQMGVKRNFLKELRKWNTETGIEELFYHDVEKFHKIFEYNIKTLTINELQ